ncbi:MAG: A/G-specific adenine glycosylase [Synechococcaceae cyanobacterium SM2_3_2]|nr:A/G-specific adenine glycosylase [Synechococcaceae cyanobacterium SM2_3_2]
MRQTLRAWYQNWGRVLPWRQTRDPYAIWVSEIMLQQTQVKTVLPYYQRWLESLPTLADLAQADRDQVLKLWEGLGYYRRAHNLHRAAQQIVEQHQGSFPAQFEQVMALPGIGRTTAGGILSAAFDQRCPILDGNVKRVLARLGALPVPPAKALPQLWQLSETLLDPDYPRDFNQALMDLGATLCQRRDPDCDNCPWQTHCCAYNQGRVEQLPMQDPTPPRPHKVIAVAVVFRGHEVLIDQRLETSMLGGLWEFPGGKIELGESPADCVVREVKEEIGIDVTAEAELATIEHEYTHFTITLIAYICRYQGGEAQPLQCADVRWIPPEQLKDFAFPMANQKLFPYLQQWLQTHT